MHIVFATMQFGPGYQQGTERYLENLGLALMAQGHRVTVLAGDPEGLRVFGDLRRWI